MKSGFKYQRIKELILSEAAKSGIDKLPSERELCRLYDISRTTARKALKLLHDEKQVTRTVGRGTFIDFQRKKVKISILAINCRDELKNYFKSEADAFTRHYSNADIKVVDVDHSDLVRFIREEQGVKLVYGSNFGYLNSMGFLKPLNDFSSFYDSLNLVQSKYVEWRRSLDAKALCYSMPLFAGVETFAFNVKYAQELGLDAQNGPSCMDDILKWSKAAADSGNFHSTAIGHPSKKKLPSLPLSFYSNIANGKRILCTQNDGTVCFDFGTGKEWMEFFKKLYKDGNIYLPDSKEITPLLQGKTLFEYSAGPWMLSQKKAYPDIDIKVCSLPPVTPGACSFSLIKLGGMALIEDGFSNPKEKNLAWEFIRFLSTDTASQQRMVDSLSFLPVSSKVFTSLQTDPAWTPYIQALFSGFLRCDHPVQHMVYKVIRKYFFRALDDEVSTEDASNMITEICSMLIETENERNLF